MSMNYEQNAMFKKLTAQLENDVSFMGNIQEIKHSTLWLDVIIAKYAAVTISLIVFIGATMFSIDILVWLSLIIMGVNIFQIIRFFFQSDRNLQKWQNS